MLDKIEQHNDWQSKYQATFEELERRECQWVEIEALLRKAIGRLSIAGRGMDDKLDQHLCVIQQLSRDKLYDKLDRALKQLSDIVSSLDGPPAAEKSIRSDPIMLMLELLQGIHFDQDQRQHLKDICTGLLKSVANGHDRDIVSRYVKELALLINENFDNLDTEEKAATIVFKLLDLLDLESGRNEKIRQQFNDTRKFREQELQSLAVLINEQLNPGSPGKTIDSVMTTLLERLAIVQGVSGATQAIQSRVHEGITDEQWADTLNDIVG